MSDSGMGGTDMSPTRSDLGRTAGALGAAGAAVGGAFTATLATACCVGPVIAPIIIALIGAGGAAWAAGLKPYSPYLLAGSALLLGYAFWSIYRSRAACELDASPTRWRSILRRVAVVVAWISAVLWLVALGANLFLP